MSIRIRMVDGLRIALCAYETDSAPGDLYLDDADHYALAAKFRRDWQGQTNNFAYPEEWAAMDTQKLRDAETRPDLLRYSDFASQVIEAEHLRQMGFGPDTKAIWYFEAIRLELLASAAPVQESER